MLRGGGVESLGDLKSRVFYALPNCPLKEFKNCFYVLLPVIFRKNKRYFKSMILNPFKTLKNINSRFFLSIYSIKVTFIFSRFASYIIKENKRYLKLIMLNPFNT